MQQNDRLTEQFFTLGKKMAFLHFHDSLQGDADRLRGRALSLLLRFPEIDQGELVYLLDIPVQRLQGLLEGMEAEELITRSPAEDRPVTLTDKGKTLAERGDSDEPEALFSCLSEEEQQTLSGYLERLSASLDAQTQKENAEPGTWESCGFPMDMLHQWARKNRHWGHPHHGHGMQDFDF